MNSRFDYTKYDDKANMQQAEFKREVTHLEQLIESNLKSPRAKSLAITKLEECYMWIGKAVRDDQIERNGSAEPQEDRSGPSFRLTPSTLALMVKQAAYEPYAFRSTINPDIIKYRKHPHGANGAFKRAPDMDKVIQ